MPLAPRLYYVQQLLLGSLALLATGCMPSERDREFARFDEYAAKISEGKGGFFDFHHTNELLHKHAGLPGLTVIWFSMTQLNDSGVAELPQYPDLEELAFYELGINSRLRDSWLEILKACPKLKSLGVTEWSLPGFSVAKALELPHLRQLTLEVSSVPGVDGWIRESIKTLHRAQRLKKLAFGGEFESYRQELSELRKALPNCRLVFTTPKGTEYDIPIDR